MSPKKRKLLPMPVNTSSSKKKNKQDGEGNLLLLHHPAILKGNHKERLSELQRLVKAMEYPTPTKKRNDILLRADAAQNLWRSVSVELKSQNEKQHKKIMVQVERACLAAKEQAAAMSKEGSNSSEVDKAVKDLFHTNTSVEKDSVTAASAAETVDDEGLPMNDDIPYEQEPSSSVYKPEMNAQDVQKLQREQIEDAIKGMAAQMKNETERIHTNLRGQKTNLSEMEDVAAENVDHLSSVARDVNEHVAQGWGKAVGTWTLIMTVAAAFVFCMITIQIIPKRQGACLIFCGKPDDQFCRFLANGEKECINNSKENKIEPVRQPIPAPKEGQDEEERIKREIQESLGHTSQKTKKETSKMAQECEIGMEGTCIDGKLEKQLDASAMDPFGDGGIRAADGMAENVDIPLFEGKPFAASDLRKAAAAGDMLTLSSMLEIKPEWVDAADKNGWSALHLAARSGNIPVVELLLSVGGNPLLVTNAGSTTVDVATKKLGSHHPVVELLSAAVDKSEEEEQDEKLQIKEKEEQNDGQEEEEHEADSLLQGRSFTINEMRSIARDSNIPLLKEMFAVKPEWVDEGDENGWTMLHEASRLGRVDIATTLLDAGAKVELETGAGLTALQLAYDSLGADHPVTTLLSSVSKSILSTGHPFSSHTLSDASLHGNQQVISEILEKRPDLVNIGDSNGWTALHQAARSGSSEVVVSLLDHGADLNAQTSTLHTPLDVAVQIQGKESEVAFVLAKAVGSVLPDESVFVPADVREAAQVGDVDRLSRMLQLRPDWVVAGDENGWAPIHQAARAGHVDVVEVLLDWDADPHQTTGGGVAALDIAKEEYGPDHEVVKLLISR